MYLFRLPSSLFIVFPVVPPQRCEFNKKLNRKKICKQKKLPASKTDQAVWVSRSRVAVVVVVVAAAVVGVQVHLALVHAQKVRAKL